MDRAEKLRKYGSKNIRMSKVSRRQSAMPGQSVRVGAGVIGAVVLLSLAAGALLFLFRHRKAETELAYVTNAELASCMSFLADDMLLEEWDADAYVTQGQIKELLQKLGLAEAVPATGGKERLKREAVMDYYAQILDYLDLAGAVEKETVLVLSWDGSSCRTEKEELQADVDTLALSEFHTYGIYRMDQKILGIIAESEKTVPLRKTVVQSVKDDKITVEYGKAEYELACLDADGLRELARMDGAASCTLCVKGGAVTKIKDIQSGQDPAVAKADKKGQELPKTVDVLLLNNGSVHYDQIYLTCNTGWTVKKSGKKTDYTKKKVLSVKKLKLKKGKSALVESSGADGLLYLSDKNGAAVSKGYYGKLTVYKDADGYYLVNNVSIEKYLYSVVASEMPASFGTEALKAQAVCARSYVYRQMAANDYSRYHAQIDDSTNYQVYNQSEAVEADRQAVQATEGEVLYAQDELVNAYYFSSSFGRTANMEIWNQEESAYPYLKIKSLSPSESKKKGQKLDLSKEKDFLNYIRSPKKDAFDSDSRYYRWKAKVELSACLKELKEKLLQRQELNPDNITFYSTVKKKPKKVASLKGFGGVEKIYCSKRGKSGAILVLTVQFEFGKVEIRSEYNIRSILGCAMEQITYADGTTDTSVRFLPSAYFSISFDKKSSRYVLTGGGNGHGMGMSQYGAAGMAKAGWNYKQILEFFYDGARVQHI